MTDRSPLPNDVRREGLKPATPSLAIMRVRFFGRKEKAGVRRAKREPSEGNSPNVNHLLNALIRLHSRETFRAAALGCTIPFCAARMTNGSATRRTAAAAPWSPAAIASSTLWTKLRIWMRRDRLTHGHLDGPVFQGLPGDWLSGVRISPASNKGKGVNSMIASSCLTMRHNTEGSAGQPINLLTHCDTTRARATKLNTVDHVVNGAMKPLAKKE
jgi:hypothetical protein